jgi:hypothetical protein
VRLRVVELDGADAAEVVVVARKLRVRRRGRERRFGDELVRLRVEGGGEVRVQEPVDERCERVVVVPEGGRALRGKIESVDWPV